LKYARLAIIHKTSARGLLSGRAALFPVGEAAVMEGSAEPEAAEADAELEDSGVFDARRPVVEVLRPWLEVVLLALVEFDLLWLLWVEDEVVDDEVVDEVVDDEVVDDEVLDDEVLDDEVVEDEVAEDEVVEEALVVFVEVIPEPVEWIVKLGEKLVDPPEVIWMA
jgi:hypothetical protein